MNIIEKLKAEGYEVVKGKSSDNRNYDVDIINPQGEKREVSGVLLDTIIKISPKLIETTRRELIQALYNPSEDDWIYYEHRCDRRTYDYLESIAKEIGFVNFERFEFEDGEWIENETTKKISIGFETFFISRVNDIFKVQVEYKYYEMDEVVVNTYTFVSEPSEKDIIIAVKLQDLKAGLLCYRYKIEYPCSECGCKTHWLDVPGDFLKKLKFMDIRYCGC